jgi:hypothetical protein
MKITVITKANVNKKPAHYCPWYTDNLDDKR